MWVLEWDGEVPHVEVNDQGICESTDVLEHVVDCGERVLLLLDDLMKLMTINYKSNGTVLFVDHTAWFGPFPVLNLFCR